MTAQEAVSDRFYSALYQAMLHPSLAKSSALSQFLGLFLQAVKVDVSARRAAALLKRLLQVAAHQAPNVACAVLVVTSEVLKSKAALWPALTHAEDGGGAEARDVPDADDVLVTAVPPAGQDVPAWPPEDHYDMHKRAPQHARAERACVWELAPLAQHAHPSVSTMARTLLAGSNILYDGDPLSDLTLLAFLDKFVKKCAPAPACLCELGLCTVSQFTSALCGRVADDGRSVEPGAFAGSPASPRTPRASRSCSRYGQKVALPLRLRMTTRCRAAPSPALRSRRSRQRILRPRTSSSTST